MKQKKRLLILALVLIAFPALLLSRVLYRQFRQEILNRSLIAAIEANNTRRALQLLADGANGNAHKPLPPRFVQIQYGRIRIRIRNLPSSPGNSLDENQSASALLLLYNGVPDSTTTGPDPALVRSLLDHGAHINDCDETGCSPLYLASGFTDADTVRLLLERGAQTEQASNDGSTPLMGADSQVTQVLLEHSAHIDAVDHDGETALIYAARAPIHPDDIEVIRILLKHGANVHLRNRTGATALDIVKHENDPNAHKVLALLRQFGAK